MPALPPFVRPQLGAAAFAAGLLCSAVAAAQAVDETALVRSYRAEAQAYEHGDGVPRDGARAAMLYCKAARLGDARSQYALGWMYANGRGVERDDLLAAFFLRAAAEQGLAPAERLLARLPETVEVPECMREPPAVAVVVPRPAPAAEPAPAAALPPPPKIAELRRTAPPMIVDLVDRLAPQYQLEPDLVLAIIRVESNFDTVARSPKNAQGLMQLIPETAERFAVRNAYDPTQNVRGGMAYLRWLLAYFEGDLTLVTAAYNAGEGTVERYRGIPPYRETRDYVRRVLDTVGVAFHPFDASVTAPSRAVRAGRVASR